MFQLFDIPVYPGYSAIGSKPSCRSSTVLVHSQTPPKSDWPQSLLPLSVTETGCQCLKPTLAPSKSMKRSCGLGREPAPEAPLDKGLDGGLSSTPLLIKCLATMSTNDWDISCKLTRSRLESC